MYRSFIKSLFVALTALIGAVGLAHAEEAVYACTNADGSVDLASAPTGDNCEKLVSAPDAAPASPAAAGPKATAVAVIPATTADAPQAPNQTVARGSLIPPPAVEQQPRNATETVLAQHRDAVIQQTNSAYTADQPSAGANPAVSRRYLMINRSAYQQSLGISPE